MMARMFPEKFPMVTDQTERRKTDTEKRIYEILSKRLPQSFTVFWSVSWLAKRRTTGMTDGEADFVVVHPEHGVLIIEIKGGSIKRDGLTKKWTSTDRDGVTYDIDPFAQVKRQFYSLRDKLRESPLTAPFTYPMTRAVWFPNLSIGSIDLGLDAPREIILDMHDLNDPQASLLRIFDSWSGERGNALYSPHLSQAAIDALVRLLAPTYEIRTPLAAEFLEEQDVIRQLTEEQFTVLDELSSHRQARISGIAGSGKTMLAIEKARRLANEGYHVLLLCFNRPLADFLAASVAAEERVKVFTYASLCEWYAGLANIDLEQHRIAQDYFDRVLPDALMTAVDSVDVRFDAIVVDEGLDIKQNWWIPLQFTLSDPDDGILYIFFDDNQSIFTGRKGYLPIQEPEYRLTVNCRNTQAIHRMVRRYYKGNYQLGCQGAEGREVDIRTFIWDGVREELRRTLHHLVVENNVPLHDIVVLTPIRKKSTWQEGMRLGNFTLTWTSEPMYSNTVYCSTIQAFKGLERPVVILTEMDEAIGDRTALKYVAMSRATNHLIILGEY